MDQHWTRRAGPGLEAGEVTRMVGANTANGTRLILWTCQTTPDQKWTLP